MAISCSLNSISIPSGPAFTREPRKLIPSIPFDPTAPIAIAGSNAVYTPIVSFMDPFTMTVRVTFEGDISSYVGRAAYVFPGPNSLSSLSYNGTVQLIPQPTEQQGASGQMVMDFSIVFSTPDFNVPWGIIADVSFQIQIGQEAPLDVSGTCFLKLFGLANDLPEYATLEGIPVQFLEMMVLPTFQNATTTMAAWIESVAWTCFISQHDEKCAKDPAIKPAMHCYRYNAFLAGVSNYTFAGGSVFDLDTWLTNCNPTNPKQWYGVNCYDMSAVLQVALSLGLPYHYIDQNGQKVPDVLTVARAYRYPYGYIKTEDLIGWGDTNSPFFEDGENKNINSQTRESFKNHAWVSIKLSNSDRNALSALDACAGPTAIPIPMTEYLTNSIDVPATLASKKKEFNNFNNNQTPVEQPGVLHIVLDQPLNFWQKTAFIGDSTLHLTYQGEPLSIDGYGWPSHSLVAIQGLMGKNNVKPIPVSVQGLLDAGFCAAAQALDAGQCLENTPIPLQASAEFSYGPFTIQTPEMAVTSGGTIFRFSLWKELTGSPLFNISVAVLTDLQTALEYLVGHLSLMNHDHSTTWPISDDQITSGKIDLVAQKEVPVAAAIRSNVVITIDGINNSTAINSVIQAMSDFTLDSFGKPLNQVAPSSVEMKTTLSKEVPEGQIQWVKFDVPGAIDFTLASKTKTIRIVQDPVQTTEAGSTPGDYLWKVPVSFVDIPDVNLGSDAKTPEDKFVAAFASPDTYYTTSAIFPVFQ